MYILKLRGLTVLGTIGTPAVTITGLSHGTGTKACKSLDEARAYLQKVLG